MTLKQFFTGRAIVFGALLIVGLGFFAYETYAPVHTEISKQTEESQKSTEPIFTWQYEKSTSLNLDGQPNTAIYLQVKYSSGTDRKLIATVPSSCNDLPDIEKDSVANSTNIQCYGAGLGYRFKIVKGENSYRVMRKTFEEASPEYNPPASVYEMVSEFPLSHL